MPYFTIQLKERVIADGSPGVVIAIGNSHNKSAHFFVRLDSGEDIWFSRDEVVPESHQKEKNGEKQAEATTIGIIRLIRALRGLNFDFVASRLRKRG